MNENTSIIKPLSEAEETTLIIDAQAGNERAMERLLDAYAPAIERAARNHTHDGDYEDALQEARISFIKVVHDHDFTKSKRLHYYVATRLGQDMAVHLSENHSQWDIPGRTLRRYLKVYRTADEAITNYYDGVEHEDERIASIVRENYHLEPFDLGAMIAPFVDDGMATANFIQIGQMLHGASIEGDTFDGDGGEASGLLDTNVGVLMGAESDDDRWEKVRNNFLVAALKANAESDLHLRVIDMAYGFEGDLEVAEDTFETGTKALAPYSDNIVAAALSYETGETYSRPKVNRLRNQQIDAWRATPEFMAEAVSLGRDKYAKSEASDGKDN